MRRSKKKKPEVPVGVSTRPAAAAIPWSRLPKQVRGTLAYLLFALLSLACLAIPSYPHVFPQGGGVKLLGPDAYFHLRHVKAVLNNYPVIQRHDPMVSFPWGENGLNQGAFDVLLATMVKLTALSPSLILAWVSPICQLAAVGAAFLWFLRRGQERCAYLFLLFALLYPGPTKALSALGNGDHHAFEILMAILVAYALDHYLRPETSWKWAPVAVTPLFVFFLSWAGTPLHLFLVGLAFYIRAWRPLQQDERLATKGAVYGLTLVVLVVTIRKFWPWAIIWHVSEGIFLMGALALLAGYPILVAIASRPWKRPVVTAVGLIGCLLALAYATPTGSRALEALFESRTRQIAEHTAVSMPLVFFWFGFLWVAALAAPVLIWRRKAYEDSLVPLTFGLGLVFFWIKTYDFSYYSPIALAAGAAYALGTVKRTTYYTLGALALLTVIPLLPGAMEPPWGDRKSLRDTILYTHGMESASKWLKGVQGPTWPGKERDYGLLAPWDLGNILAETSDTPVGYAETASNGLARLLYSDQPDRVYEKMVKNGKPLRYLLLPARNLAEKFMGEMGAADLKFQDMFKRGARVSCEGRNVVLLAPTQRNTDSLLNRLYWDQGKDIGHFRLVYESPEQVLHLQRIRPDRLIEFFAWPATEDSLSTNLKPLLEAPDQVHRTSRGNVTGARQAAEIRIFEAVPGALLSGLTLSGAGVKAELVLSAPATRRRWTCSWSTVAEPSGRFSLRVPYSTTQPLNENPDTVLVSGPYTVTVAGQQTLVQVSEDDVQQQRSVMVP